MSAKGPKRLSRFSEHEGANLGVSSRKLSLVVSAC